MRGEWQTAEPEDMEAMRRHLRLVHWADLGTLPRRAPLVKGLIDEAAFSVWYGGSNTGKSAIVQHLSMCIATGQTWRGLSVTQGPVLYIAAEGGLGIAERLEGLRLFYGVNPAHAPLIVMPDAINMHSSADDIKLLVSELAEKYPSHQFALIVIDTLSRTFAGGNENSSEDMGAFVANCDLLRHETGAHVLVVHHNGKDSERGARGHSLLRAAADAEMEIAADANGVSLTAKKQRDHIGGDIWRWKLEPVDIGVDADGDVRRSIVAVPDDSETSSKRAANNRKLTPMAEQGLACLRDCIGSLGQPAQASHNIPSGVKTVSLQQWQRHMELGGIVNAEGNPREQRRRIVVTLKSAGFIGVWDDFVWCVT
jgi:hypothetical protein